MNKLPPTFNNQPSDSGSDPVGIPAGMSDGAAGATSVYYSRSGRTLGLFAMFWASLFAHLLTIGTVVTVAFVMNLLGFNITLFDDLMMKPRDIEFVLVENTAQPRNPNTKNRADKASRSGGEKTNRPQAENQKMAGSPQQKTKPQPTRTASRPTQRSTPQQTAPRKTTTSQAAPRKTPSKQPPRKTPTRPAQQIASASPTLPPSPVAPNIKLPPAPSNPSSVTSGPVIKTSGGGSSSGSSGSGSPGPSLIPGRTSSASGGSPGRAGSSGGGSGGTGSYNQSGSPGGGGGRAGIDALPEPDFGPYIAELQRRIKRNWTPPAADRSKRVVALFTISRDGRLLNIKLQNSSGTQVADDAAVAAIRLSAPFRPLPAGYRQNSIDVQFIFDYDVYKGSGSISRR